MGKKEKIIDDYIHNAADFAKPILSHIRKLVHKTCPEVEEKMKWSFPHFDYKNQMMGSMAAFKQHAVFGFWKASLMKNPILVENAKSEVAMGHLGRLTSKQDLPSDKIITAWIKEALHLNDLGIKLPKKIKSPTQKELLVPDDFLVLLRKN